MLWYLDALGRQQWIHICPAGGVRVVRKDDGFRYLKYSAFRGKSWRPGDRDYAAPQYIKEYRQDRSICTVTNFRWYMIGLDVWPRGWSTRGKTVAETIALWRDNCHEQFVADIPEHESVIRHLDNSTFYSQNSCAIEVSRTLESAGIDTAVFKPYSTRAATATKAYLQGVDLQTILIRGGWSDESTFKKWYLKLSTEIPKSPDPSLGIEEALRRNL